MIEGRGLTKVFNPPGKNRIIAVDNVDIRIDAGETLALVGESGCGKSTLSRLLLLLIPPTRGEVFFEGQALTGLKEKELRLIRRKIQIVSQQPESALNPRWKIADSICEPFASTRTHYPQEVIWEKSWKSFWSLSGLSLNRHSDIHTS
ncbi:ATP-binding cassette domain-containing protein [Methanosarcina horonobensis]|uniref:ATP-binding cassette domain-containing protein n=1 Tax=Methanosarcina horonobensis TaxID=418008 RepID=UPI000B2DCDC7|nr:ATP-binding cassette domain-containing protein [Methanosarcina horonobensis]